MASTGTSTSVNGGLGSIVPVTTAKASQGIPLIPSKRAARTSIVSFLAFLVLGLAAVSHPVPAVRSTVVVCIAILALIILVSVFFEVLQAYCFQKKAFQGRYSRNLGNTVCVVMACLVGSTALYWTTWYPNLRRDVITTSTDTVNSTYFPSIALFQRLDWSSQGHLTVDNLPPKCFLGWYNDAAPDCDSVAVPGSALPCKCDTRWDPSVTELFVWENTTYRLLVLHASQGMVSLRPTTSMLAEVWFRYNSTKALADAGRVLSPSLWVAMFDPTLSIMEALERGYTRMQLVDANALVAINLGLQLRESAGQLPAFDYELSISTIPSVSKVEDGDIGWLALLLQFPSFTRQVSNQHKAWSWSDAIAAAGSWFGLFTLLGWVTSRLATME